MPYETAEPAWIAHAADVLGYGWARSEWARAAAQPNAWFDHAKAEKVVELWPRIFRLTDDRFYNKPFHLLEWQAVVVRLLTGWKVPVNVADETTGKPARRWVRLFRRLLLWVARKNGKSEFLAALGLLFWALEGTFGGQGFNFAVKEKQATTVFNKMSVMAALAPGLGKDVIAFKRHLWIPEMKSSFLMLPGKARGSHGGSPTVTVGDEMHEWTEETLELSETLHDGSGVRLQPIELYASTAGLKSNQVGLRLWEETQAILDGNLADATTLAVVFKADEDDDWTDEAVWRKANPALGQSLLVESMRRDFEKAKDSPAQEARFRCFKLNQWVEQEVRWLNIKKWDVCAPDKTAWQRFPQELRGRECYGAFDVSATTDLSALTLLFPPLEAGEPMKLITRFWCPEAKIEERSKTDRVNYAQWRDMGLIAATPGDYVDQAYMRAAIEEARGLYEIRKIGFDKWNASQLYTDLVKGGMEPDLFAEMRQGHQTLGEPTKRFEILVLSGQLDHGGNPVLRWMAKNCAVRFDENMNYVVAKKRSTDRIDGIATAVMATGVWMAGGQTDSYLETSAMVWA